VDTYVGKVVPKTPAAGKKRTQSWTVVEAKSKDGERMYCGKCATDIVGTLIQRGYFGCTYHDDLDVGKCIVGEKPTVGT
jgi:hypothetical protein